MVRTLDEELAARGEDAQREGGRKRIVALVIFELRLGRRPFARDGRGRADALGLQRAADLKPGEGVCCRRLCAWAATARRTAADRKSPALS